MTNTTIFDQCSYCGSYDIKNKGAYWHCNSCGEDWDDDGLLIDGGKSGCW